MKFGAEGVTRRKSSIVSPKETDQGVGPFHSSVVSVEGFGGFRKVTDIRW